MTPARWISRACALLLLCVIVSSCGFQGLNSLPLPGAVGRGSGAVRYVVELRNVGTLEPNSPVMLDDVVVGSVTSMRVRNRQAEVSISVRPDVVVPANARASVGQTSLLGSMHLALDPPVGEAPQGRLERGATIPLSISSTYPSTEQTLASVAAVVTTGGLGQIGDVIHNLNIALAGRGPQLRDLLNRLNDLMAVFDGQRQDIVETIHQMDRIASVFADQRHSVEQALKALPPALDVLLKERPRFTTALDKLRVFSNATSTLVNAIQGDLVENLKNLEPTLRALADVGPDLDTALAYATVFPLGQNTIDRAIRGDYLNLFVVADLTVNRFKRSLFLGTRWGNENLDLVPAPGDPGYDAYYTKNPLGVGVTPPPIPAAVPPGEGTQPPEASTPAPPPAATSGGG
ncbi:MCE family protein [Mycobacterium sp. EPa45]|uniref:MCE family protein n=1 Tax=Mycobacterium sp. EPa45 TaxID=1545728 RepID=UPI00069A1B69|nr:MCE family protein [Mycobacterium sp. EPa45]